MEGLSPLVVDLIVRLAEASATSISSVVPPRENSNAYGTDALALGKIGSSSRS
ncbi:hypothetical protein GWK48_11120 [Metallosphaera tengchongensis]|uniref:Uncharacterized protein n=1 Tax=Metallosphaera tengchongensis TaxID=1532350 RepID=A0A6N0P0R5_9CREN|nr:hypothetical protein [Metallosphaera tengchongensis]QKR00860.1 hypothetical protein GWK48_11120 [Metallosphaera tengchongensis]